MIHRSELNPRAMNPCVPLVLALAACAAAATTDFSEIASPRAQGCCHCMTGLDRTVTKIEAIGNMKAESLSNQLMEYALVHRTKSISSKQTIILLCMWFMQMLNFHAVPRLDGVTIPKRMKNLSMIFRWSHLLLSILTRRRNASRSASCLGSGTHTAAEQCMILSS